MTNAEPQPPMLTIQATASHAGVSVRTIQRWTRQGRLPHVRVGRVLRYPADALDGMLIDADQTPSTITTSNAAQGTGDAAKADAAARHEA